MGDGCVQCPHPSLVIVAHIPSCPPAHAESPETSLYFRVMSTRHKKEGGGVLLWYLHSSPPPLLLVQPLLLRPLISAPSLLATLLSLWRDTDTWSPGPWRVLSAVLYLLSVRMCSEGGRRTSAPTDAGLQDEPLAPFAVTGHLSAWIHPGDLLRVSISLHLESSAP